MLQLDSGWRDALSSAVRGTKLNDQVYQEVQFFTGFLYQLRLSTTKSYLITCCFFQILIFLAKIYSIFRCELFSKLCRIFLV